MEPASPLRAGGTQSSGVPGLDRHAEGALRGDRGGLRWLGSSGAQGLPPRGRVRAGRRVRGRAVGPL
eukprot:772351-Lingulodinium_polyedra.AAC.1